MGLAAVKSGLFQLFYRLVFRAKSRSISGLAIFPFVKRGSHILRLFPSANIIAVCTPMGSNTTLGPLSLFFHPQWMIPCFGSDSQTVAQLELRVFKNGPAVTSPCLPMCNSWNGTPYPSSCPGRSGSMKSQQARRYFMLLEIIQAANIFLCGTSLTSQYFFFPVVKSIPPAWKHGHFIENL